MTQDRFWLWSLDYYNREAVQDTLIDLQDAHGLDVNTVLFCYWLAHNHFALTEETAQRAVELKREWLQPIINPYRKARRSLKSTTLGSPEKRDVLYNKLLALELQLEELHQDALEALTVNHSPPLKEVAESLEILARANLGRYFSALSIPKEEQSGLFALPHWAILNQAALSSTQH